jgi:hypothetical protein
MHWVSFVDVPKSAEVTLKMRDKIVSVSGDPEAPFISLLHPDKTVLILWFVHIERDQGPRPVTTSTPYLSTRKKGPS